MMPFACITHNTYEENLESIITNGLLLGGGGITHALHSQLSAFHIGDNRLQESSRGSTTTAVIHFNIEKTKPLLNVCASGVLATRQCLPGSFIERIWVKREVPIRIRDGRMVMSRRWITYADVRAVDLRIAGWIGARKSGYSDEFKDAIKRLNKHSRSLAFEDVFKQTALSRGFGDFICKCCPQCGYPMLQIQTACLKCGMVATYEGANAKSVISVEALKKVEDDALAARVGLAPRVTIASPAIAEPMVEEEETVGNLTELEANEKLIAGFLEYKGSTQLISMRAIMANSLFRSIRHRLAWRALPQRAADDRSAEGAGTHCMERIKQDAFAGYLPYWMQKGAALPWDPIDRWDTLPRDMVNDLPETEWSMWLAGIVDQIENAGRMNDFKVVDNKYNSFREAIVGKVCFEVFGSKYPTKESVFINQGPMVARMFAKGSQGRANKARQLRAKAASIIEQYGAQILTGSQLERARAASTHGKRGFSKAASVADTRYRTKSPPRKRSTTPPAKRITLKSRPRSPGRPVMTLVGKQGMTDPCPPPATAKRARETTRSLVGKKAQQAASVVGRATSPSITSEERAKLEMRAKASAGKRAERASASTPVPIAAVPTLPTAKAYLSSTPRAGSAGSTGSQGKRRRNASVARHCGSGSCCFSRSTDGRCGGSIHMFCG